MRKRIVHGLAAFLLSAGSLSAGNGTFDVTTEPGTDPGAEYANFNEAGAGVNPVVAIGFQIDMTHLNNSPVSFSGPFAAFCTELEEPILEATYTHQFAELGKISRGRAGEAGTASSAIPAGGIGALAAARVQALFDNHYTSTTLSSWTFDSSNPTTHAFQLALWEVTHDTDLSLSSTSGSIFVGAQSGTTQTNALALAETWLGELSGVTTAYMATTWNVWALENVGSPGAQDILFATAIGSGESSTIGAAVPEPTSALLLLAGCAAMGMRRRRP